MAGPQLARDLWRPRDLEEDPDVQADGITPDVGRHGCVLPQRTAAG